jgi:hypothetical protein
MSNTDTKYGWLPSLGHFGTRLLALGKMSAKKQLTTVLGLWAIGQKNKKDLYISRYSAGGGYDLRPGRGNVSRRSFFSCGGALGKRSLVTRARGMFLPGAIVGFEEMDARFYNTTDCPLTTGGIGERLTTADTVTVCEVPGTSAEPHTLWREF